MRRSLGHTTRTICELDSLKYKEALRLADEPEERQQKMQEYATLHSQYVRELEQITQNTLAIINRVLKGQRSA